MKKSLFLLSLPVLLFASSCKNEKKQTPQQTMEEASKLPSMHVDGSNFSVAVPTGWTTKDTMMNSINFYFMIAPATAAQMGNTSINVIHEGMQNFSLEQYKEATMKSMEQGMPGFEMMEKGEIEAGDLKGIWFSYKMGVSGAQSYAVNYTFSKDNVAYLLTAVTPVGSFEKYKSTFDAVARSFKLKE